MFQGLFPSLSKGIPDLEIQPFEPLHIKRINVARNTGEVVQLNGSFENLKISGPSNATVSRASLNLKNGILNFDLGIPRLRINATYNLRGNILLLPLVGTGNVHILLKNIKTSVSTKISTKNIPKVSAEFLVLVSHVKRCHTSNEKYFLFRKPSTSTLC